jgi:uncharacterized glyoxalase superfamily protein PhnB
MLLTQLVPSIESNDMAGTISFYRNLLGMQVLNLYPENEPYWALLEKDGVQLMVTERNAHAKTMETAFTGSFYVFPDDVEALWVKIAAKIDPEYIAWPLEVFDYGMMEFAITDPNGYLWRFGQEAEVAQMTISSN